MPTLHLNVAPQSQDDLDRLAEKKSKGPKDSSATLGFKPMRPTGSAKNPKSRPTNPPQTGAASPRRAPVTPAQTAMTARGAREAKLEAHRRVPGAVPRAVSR